MSLKALTWFSFLSKCLPCHSIEQTTEILLHLSPDEAANLKEGINFLRNKKTGKDYILYKNKSRLRACKNMCKHQGGLFIKDIEDFDGRYQESFAFSPATLLKGIWQKICSFKNFKGTNQQIISPSQSITFTCARWGYLSDLKMLWPLLNFPLSHKND